jgi:hypothetical protein
MLSDSAVRRLQVQMQTTEALARSHDLAGRLRRARFDNEQLVSTTRDLLRLCWADYARTWAERGLRGTERRKGLTWFAIEGVIEGRTVRGAWSPGHLKCSPLLESRARLLIELDETFLLDDPPACLAASLDEPPVAVALTLMRACDRTVVVQLGLTARAGQESRIPLVPGL